LEELRDEFDFTVFSTAFENPDPSRIRWVRTPAVKRPLVALYSSYFLTSTGAHLLDRRRRGPYDVVQAVEGYTNSCDISYVHFCHRAYLRHYASIAAAGGLRGAVRGLDHRLRAAGEGRALSSPRLIVVPSPALREELEREHGVDGRRLRVVPNPVEARKFEMPRDFAREATRSDIGASPGDVLAVFIALGHFERKGLPELLDAMTSTDPKVRLVVVGGRKDLVGAYRSRADRLGLASRVSFVGMQADVRPYLWAADAFVSASSYETFSLVLHQAAAAHLPLIVTPLAGAAGFFRNKVHGLAITREPGDIARALTRIADMAPEERRRLGANARMAVEGLGVESFANAWRSIYREALTNERPTRGD
jgi:glycosyltransferase involved in cell wall biosynthesis